MTCFVGRIRCIRHNEAWIDMPCVMTTMLPLFNGVGFEIHFFCAHRIGESKLIVNQRTLRIRVLQFVFGARLNV